MSLSQLRPLGFGEILDGAFTLYRRHFGVLVATSLLAHAPVMLMWGWFVLLGGDDAGGDGIVLLGRLMGALAAVLGSGALTQQASAAYLGGEVSVAEGFRAAWRHFFRLLGALFIQNIAFIIGLVMLVVPGFYFFTVLFAMVPVVVIERRGAAEASTRSGVLAKGAWGGIFGVMAVLTVIVWLPSLAALWGVDMLTAVMGTPAGAAAALVQVAYSFARSLTLPVQAAGTVLLYYDRRVRIEALDLAPAAFGVPAAVG
jgi:hypothetical protein